jgi:cytochrome c556
MRRDQWNFVFFACLLSIAAFSIFVAFRMTGRTGYWGGYYSWDTGAASPTSSPARVSMRVVAAANNSLAEQFGNDPRNANRRIVLTAAASIAAHGDDLMLNPPEGLSKGMGTLWDSYIEQMKAAAESIADVAAKPEADLRQVSRSYTALKMTCVGCHTKFGVNVPEKL